MARFMLCCVMFRRCGGSSSASAPAILPPPSHPFFSALPPRSLCLCGRLSFSFPHPAFMQESRPFFSTSCALFAIPERSSSPLLSAACALFCQNRGVSPGSATALPALFCTLRLQEIRATSFFLNRLRKFSQKHRGWCPPQRLPNSGIRMVAPCSGPMYGGGPAGSGLGRPPNAFVGGAEL